MKVPRVRRRWNPTLNVAKDATFRMGHPTSVRHPPVVTIPRVIELNWFFGGNSGRELRRELGEGTRGQTGGVHPKSETEIMVTVLKQENTCHERTRITRSMERS